MVLAIALFMFLAACMTVNSAQLGKSIQQVTGPPADSCRTRVGAFGGPTVGRTEGRNDARAGSTTQGRKRSASLVRRAAARRAALRGVRPDRRAGPGHSDGQHAERRRPG